MTCKPVLVCFFFSRELIAHLKVFAKFTNPRSLYMESSLGELYNQVMLILHASLKYALLGDLSITSLL